MIHQLKLQKSFFEEKIAGLKPWELRFNDRGFKVGDYLGENEVIEKDGEWVETGRFVVEKITNITYPEDCPGIQKGWVILTTEPCILTTESDFMVGALSGGIGPRRDSSALAMHVYGGKDNDGGSEQN